MGAWSSLSPAASVTIGIIVGLLSTCVQSVGLTLQRKSHMLEDEKQDCEPRRPAYRRRRWQVGMFLFLIANIVGSTIQITTLPLPLLSTLQASGLVFNSILASLLLKEQWTWRTGWGTLLVAAGAVLISLFSALPEPSHNLTQLLDLLRMKGFLVWFILSLVFVLAVLVMDFTMRRLIPPRQRENPRLHLIRGMSYGAISGVLSAHALLLAKSAVELIVRSFADHVNQFSNYRSWLILLAFLVLALSQLYYLHLGLRLISTSILYPFVFCIYNIVAILDGLIYFRQMDRLPPLHAGLIALGTVILLAGVLALSWRLQDDETEDAEHRVMAQAEIPQTVLAPGMGFVGDPDSDENGSATAEETDPEERPLIDRRTRSSALVASRRRKRASTLKEVFDIWEELGDGNQDEEYGTFQPREPGRSVSADHGRLARRRRRSSAGVSLEADADTEDANDGTNDAPDHEPDDDALTNPTIQRSRTMPGPRRISKTMRRRSTHANGSALFSDMLKSEWWRPKRKDSDEDDESGQGRRRSTRRSDGANHAEQSEDV